MKKKIASFLILIMALSLSFTALVACKDNPNTENKNETVPLVLQASELDGVFNPFFYSSAYDEDVIELATVSLLAIDPNGAIVAGDDYATVAKSYSIDLKDDGTAEYEIVLKNGLKFSDGTAITADDVLFNYYVYLDPKYDGSSTLYTLPIQGLSEYRTQTTPEIAAKYSALADKIFAIGEIEDYVVTSDNIADGITQELYNAYWSYVDQAGISFAQEIYNYVFSEYGSDSYIKAYFHPALNYATVRDTAGLDVAYAMSMWGFGEITEPLTEDANGDWVNLPNVYVAYDANNKDLQGLPYFNAVEDVNGGFVIIDGKSVVYNENEHASLTRYKFQATAYDEQGFPLEGDYVRTQSAGFVKYDAAKHIGLTRYKASYTFKSAVTETVWTMKGDDIPTIADYWAEIRAAYGTDYSESTGINYESADTAIEVFIKELFVSGEGAKEVEGGVPTVTGLTKGTKTISGESFETIKIITTTQDPTTILKLGVMIAPKNYYTNGYTYKTNAIANYGAEFNSTQFMAHLKTKNSTPVGAGPYKFVEFKDNVVYFERNDNFNSFGLGNAKIKYVRIKVIAGGQEYDAVKSGEVHYATVSATSDVVSEVNTLDDLTSVLVDNLGYGYIAINPKYYPTIAERKAIQTVFDLSKVYEYYPNGLAEIIYRAMSKVSWAYPEDATGPLEGYGFDSTGAKALEYFLEASYTQAEGKLLNPDGEQAHFVFTIPSSSDSHPAGQIFIKAREILISLGATAEIKVDSNLIANIKKEQGVGIYALAWQAALDPDMFQVYHYESQAESVKSNGIIWLYENGTSEQKELLEELADLIDEARTKMLPAERAPIYAQALEVLAELAIEIPTYQRKNLFVYDNTVIKASSLASNVTPYWSPLQEIWNVEIA